jgi:hypothetical protein
MANTLTSQKLKDHATAWAYKFTHENDGSGNESFVTKVTANNLIASTGDGSSQRLTINKLFWSIASGASATQSPIVKLSWSGDAPNTAVTLTGSGVFDLVTNGTCPITNDIANTNGDLLISTVGFTNGAAYTIIVEGKKTAGYSSREVTDDGIS